MDVSSDAKTFTFQGNAASCPSTGAICYPDQPQMAVDRWNASPSGDQLYMVWRDFPDNGAGQCLNIFQTPSSADPTPTIACSVTSGKTWNNQKAVGSGDFPRGTVSK